LIAKGRTKGRICVVVIVLILFRWRFIESDTLPIGTCPCSVVIRGIIVSGEIGAKAFLTEHGMPVMLGPT